MKMLMVFGNVKIPHLNENKWEKRYNISFLFCYNKLIKIYLLNPTPINYLTGLKSKVDFTELKSKCWQGWVLSGSYRWKSISLPFPALRSHLHSLTHDLLPPSKPTIANWLSHYIPLTFFHFYRPLWLQWTHLDHSV